MKILGSAGNPIMLPEEEEAPKRDRKKINFKKVIDNEGAQMYSPRYCCDTECSICKMQIVATAVLLLPCHHCLCNGCYDAMAGFAEQNGTENNCPECRTPINDIRQYDCSKSSNPKTEPKFILNPKFIDLGV